ncbi:hypothetical protein ScPMuIL_009204 [Solemya velum]
MCYECGQVDAFQTLRDFDNWHYMNQDTFPYHDHAALFTGYDLIHPDSGARTVGLAFLGSMCSGGSVSVIEEGRGALDQHTSSHELGHSIGSDHDGYRTAENCSSEELYLMSPKVRRITDTALSTHPWIFSQCSKNDIHKLIDELDRYDANCLANGPVPYGQTVPSMPGQIYSADEQCEMSVGPRSTVCRECHFGEWTSICYGMVCRLPGTSDGEWILPQDGTPCGQKKWCQQGRCVHANKIVAVSDSCPLDDDSGFGCDANRCRNYTWDTREIKCCGSCIQRTHVQSSVQAVPDEEDTARTQHVSEQTTITSNIVTTVKTDELTTRMEMPSTQHSKIENSLHHYKLDFQMKVLISLYLAATMTD